jgi:hypothetical protein
MRENRTSPGVTHESSVSCRQQTPIVLHQGSRAAAFGIHGSTAAVMLIISGLLLFS